MARRSVQRSIEKLIKRLFGAPVVPYPQFGRTRYQYVINGRTYEAATLAECLALYNADVGIQQPWVLGALGGSDRGDFPTEEAHARAKATLVSFLNAEQRKTFEGGSFFEVIGSEGNRYRIVTNGSASGNVTWQGPGSKLMQELQPNNHWTTAGTYCAYPRGRGWNHKRIPVYDQILGQMLELVTDENAYLDKANLFGGTYPPTYTGRESWRPPAPEGYRPLGNVRADAPAQLQIRYGDLQPVQWRMEEYHFDTIIRRNQ